MIFFRTLWYIKDIDEKIVACSYDKKELQFLKTCANKCSGRYLFITDTKSKQKSSKYKK